MKKPRFVDILPGVFYASGFLLAYGTAGASDCDAIPLRQIIMQLLLAMFFVCIGGGLNELKKFERRRGRMHKQRPVSTAIHINTAEIPKAVQARLAVGARNLVRNIMKQPGGREALEARIAAKE